MANPDDNTPITTRQNPALVEAHNAISIRLGRLTRDEAWEQGVCATCRKRVDLATEFVDKASMQEYWITAQCQSCQDEMWKAFEPEE